MNLEWQNPKADTPNPVEETERIEAKQNLEQELSPEIIEQIMAKVVDINQAGTVYTTIMKGEFDSEKLGSVLKNGVLGTKKDSGYMGARKITKESWINTVRRDKELTLVHFDIIGNKKYKSNKGQRILSENAYLRGKDESITLLLNIDGHKEGDETIQRKELDEKKIKHNKYYFSIGNDHNFIIKNRIPPKNFRGIVFKKNAWRKPTEQEIEELQQRYFSRDLFLNKINQEDDYEDQSPEGLIHRAREISLTMLDTNKANPERLVPIYDIHGNLWWPKQISNDKIRELAAKMAQTKQSKE